MISILLLTLLASVLGLVLFRGSIGRLPGGALIGVSFLVGSGVVAGTLFVLSLLAVRWTVSSFALGIFLAAAILRLAGRFLPPAYRFTWPGNALGNWSVIPDAITAALIAGHGVFATLAPPPENDFLSLWGLKAKVFLLNGGVDWSYLTSRWNAFTLPDYPLLLPLYYDANALLSHGWDDRRIGLVTTIFGAALILIIRALFAERVGRFAASVGTLALASAALIPWIGLAEAPLVAFVASGILMLRRGIRLDCRFSITVGATLFGLAACTKNEGLTFAAAAFVSLLVDRKTRRWFAQLLPAILIPLPWLLIRSRLDLGTDLVRGNALQRMLDRLREPGQLLGAIGGEHLVGPILLIGIVLAIFVLRRELTGADRPLVATLLLQLLVFLAIYLATAYDVAWHIKWSWERVMTQVLVPFEVLLVAGLLEKVRSYLDQVA